MNNFASRVSIKIIILLLVTLAFYTANAWVSGPTYLGDEIGYLTNGAFIGGHYVGGASSYHAGYSFLIAPLFHFLDDPDAVWRGILLVNALLWGGTLVAAHSIARRLFPAASPAMVLLALALVALYPANVVMSGYAFSQSAVAFLFALSVLTLFVVDVSKPWSVLPHAILVGLQFWVHPTGAVAPVASVLALLPAAVAARQYRFLLIHFLISSGVVLLYRYGVEPWRIAGMTPPGTEAGLHYPALGKVAGVLVSPGAWKSLIGSLLGQLSYSAVASFGVTVLGAITILQVLREKGLFVPRVQAYPVPVLLFIVLAPLGCIAMTALSSASDGPNRLDQWVYGRYQDAFIPPLLLYGLLCERRRWVAIITAACVLSVGLWLTHGVEVSGYVNRVNVSGLWPEMFWKARELDIWLALGAAGIVLFSLLPRYVAWAGAAIVYCLSVSSQADWHRTLLETHSNPSEVVDFVRGNFTQGCVYFDAASIPKGSSPVSAVGERGYLYSYYFYDFKYTKGKRPNEWVEGNCQGALLTYDPSWAESHPELTLVGIESQTSLRVFVKGAPQKLRFPARRPGSSPESEWISSTSRACLVSGGCFSQTAEHLSRHTQVGALNAKGLTTTGREGFLFFGPYRPMPAGVYEIRVAGTASTLDTAYLDVSALRGKMVVMKENLNAHVPGYLGAWRFVVHEPVLDMEVRLWVSSRDSVAVNGYQVSWVGPDAPESETE